MTVRVKGTVQGVGYRPFVFRHAHANALAGWVLNDPDGIEIHVEGAKSAMDAFLRDLRTQAPAAAEITSVVVQPAVESGLQDFTIRESNASGRPSARVSP